jgi:hypothetical protein
MRSWRRAAERRRKKQPRCTSCGGRIPKSEPDVTLERLGGSGAGGRHFFRERCGLDAYKALVGGEPHAWRIIHRHIDPEAN